MAWYWVCMAIYLCAASCAQPFAPQKLTAVPKGRIHVEGNRLFDSDGEPFLIRGTQLPEFRAQPPAGRVEAVEGFEPHSSTVCERNPFTIVNLAKAIAAFERSIVSARSPYDRYRYAGERNAISDSAKRGEVLFFTDPVAACFRCHGGFIFSDAVDYAGRAGDPVEFHNNGLYNPPPNLGIYEYTRRIEDVGKFKAPTLRNIALTSPYMHDGSIGTLEAVIDHYDSGGKKTPNQDKRVRKLDLSSLNRRDLLAFLQSLTDEELARDRRFSNPW